MGTTRVDGFFVCFSSRCCLRLLLHDFQFLFQFGRLLVVSLRLSFSALFYNLYILISFCLHNRTPEISIIPFYAFPPFCLLDLCSLVALFFELVSSPSVFARLLSLF